MRASLPVLGRWPRRIAAAACLLLAAGAALTRSPTAAARCDPAQALSPRLPPGSVAVPVPVAATSADFIERGSRVGLVPSGDGTGIPAGPAALVADHLRVLRRPTPRDESTAVLLVAVPRADVGRLAQHLDRPLLALIDPP